MLESRSAGHRPDVGARRGASEPHVSARPGDRQEKSTEQWIKAPQRRNRPVTDAPFPRPGVQLSELRVERSVQEGDPRARQCPVRADIVTRARPTWQLASPALARSPVRTLLHGTADPWTASSRAKRRPALPSVRSPGSSPSTGADAMRRCFHWEQQTAGLHFGTTQGEPVNCKKRKGH